MARCTSAAATAESTPPESPQIARPSPTWARTCSTSASAMLAAVHVAPMPGELVQEPAEHLLAVRGVQHLGVVLDARQAPGPVLERGDGGARTDRDDVEPLGRLGDRVAVAHPHRLSDG